MTKLYGIKNCDTMKKAMTWLTDNGVAYEFVDYKKAGVAEANLPDWAARAGWLPGARSRVTSALRITNTFCWGPMMTLGAGGPLWFPLPRTRPS